MSTVGFLIAVTYPQAERKRSSVDGKADSEPREVARNGIGDGDPCLLLSLLSENCRWGVGRKRRRRGEERRGEGRGGEGKKTKDKEQAICVEA